MCPPALPDCTPASLAELVSMMSANSHCPGPSRRDILRFGSIGLGSLALGPIAAHRARGSDHSTNEPAVIFVWLPGGPPHQDTFDMKPNAPAEYRGAFNPIKTNVSGIEICEHLPKLAKISD